MISFSTMVVQCICIGLLSLYGVIFIPFYGIILFLYGVRYYEKREGDKGSEEFVGM